MILTVLLLGLGGLLIGGTLSLRSQGVRPGVQALVAVLAVLAVVGGVLRLTG
ncbi:MAG: hypothetical protein AVDCRST_MAG35-774 [uncultured Quadrisphaera sp.]|uniref:Uncharacterized protein n=1 Tax=uncultured Quadrisphaera sp. TaxID=904978 RepID=A0A6J4NVT5_9ACTN|nr:MAG: hypothetical protein AVDCRST_MAG35-774 [uncultured Quadrisphaera sp.]